MQNHSKRIQSSIAYFFMKSILIFFDKNIKTVKYFITLGNFFNIFEHLKRFTPHKVQRRRKQFSGTCTRLRQVLRSEMTPKKTIISNFELALTVARLCAVRGSTLELVQSFFILLLHLFSNQRRRRSNLSMFIRNSICILHVVVSVTSQRICF